MEEQDREVHVSIRGQGIAEPEHIGEGGGLESSRNVFDRSLAPIATYDSRYCNIIKQLLFRYPI